jgi:hypothetical protein
VGFSRTLIYQGGYVTMPKYRLYYCADCSVCKKRAGMAAKLNWLRRVEFSTSNPASGPLKPGQVVLENLRTGRLYHGDDVMPKMSLQIPLLFPIGLLMSLPGVGRLMGRDNRSECEDGSCSIR